MPTDTKQLTDEEVLERLRKHELSEKHDEEWKNDVARDLNLLVAREIYNIETHGLVSDYVPAVLRIVERVSEFEKIVAKGKPNGTTT